MLETFRCYIIRGRTGQALPAVCARNPKAAIRILLRDLAPISYERIEVWQRADRMFTWRGRRNTDVRLVGNKQRLERGAPMPGSRLNCALLKRLRILFNPNRSIKQGRGSSHKER
jgi:hypothetical protein